MHLSNSEFIFKFFYFITLIAISVQQNKQDLTPISFIANNATINHINVLLPNVTTVIQDACKSGILQGYSFLFCIKDNALCENGLTLCYLNGYIPNVNSQIHCQLNHGIFVKTLGKGIILELSITRHSLYFDRTIDGCFRIELCDPITQTHSVITDNTLFRKVLASDYHINEHSTLSSFYKDLFNEVTGFSNKIIIKKGDECGFSISFGYYYNHFLDDEYRFSYTLLQHLKSMISTNGTAEREGVDSDFYDFSTSFAPTNEVETENEENDNATAITTKKVKQISMEGKNMNENEINEMLGIAEFMFYGDVMNVYKKDLRNKRQAISSAAFYRKWPKYNSWNGTLYIPYEFVTSEDGIMTKTDNIPFFDLFMRVNFPAAVEEIESKTCIRFININDQNVIKPESIENVTKLQITRSNNGGCYSEHLGYVRQYFKPMDDKFVKSPNFIMLGRILSLDVMGDCAFKGTIIHELLHALGIAHTHQRKDRDKYVKILCENIENEMEKGLDYLVKKADENIKHNFEIDENLDTYGIPYHYNSIMHYGGNDFGIKEGIFNQEKQTIETIDPRYQSVIGQRNELSFFDAKLINRLYCECPYSGTNNCQFDGYADYKDCKNCICPKGDADSCKKINFCFICNSRITGERSCKNSNLKVLKKFKKKCEQSVDGNIAVGCRKIIEKVKDLPDATIRECAYSDQEKDASISKSDLSREIFICFANNGTEIEIPCNFSVKIFPSTLFFSLFIISAFFIF